MVFDSGQDCVRCERIINCETLLCFDKQVYKSGPKALF